RVDRGVVVVGGGDHDRAGGQRLGERGLLVLLILRLGRFRGFVVDLGGLILRLGGALGGRLLGSSLLGRCLRGRNRRSGVFDLGSLDLCSRSLLGGRPGLLGRGRSHVSPFTERCTRSGPFRTLVRPLSSSITKIDA